MEDLNNKEFIAELCRLLKDSKADPDEVDEFVDYFTFKYNPKSNMKALQADAPLILDSGLSDLVVKRAEKYEPEFFCEVIHILSLIKGNEQQLAKDNRIKLITKMMAMDHKNPKTQRFALKTLANISVDKDVRGYIGTTNVLQKITQMLQTYKSQEPIIIDCLNCLSNFAYRSPKNKKMIITLKAICNQIGIETIVEIISKTTSSSLLLPALVTLRNLVRSDSMQELQQHMITNEIIKKLEIYRKGNDKNDQAIISNCFWILAIMISGQKELKQFAIEHSLIQQILLTMEIFKANPDIQKSGVIVLLLLSKDSAAREIVYTARGSKILIVTLAETKDKEVKRYCNKILRRMALHKKFREEFNLTRDIKTGTIDLKRFQDTIDDAVVVAQGRAKLMAKGNNSVNNSDANIPSWKKNLSVSKSTNQNSATTTNSNTSLPEKVTLNKTQPVPKSEPLAQAKTTNTSTDTTATQTSLEIFPLDYVLKNKESLDKTQLQNYLSDEEFQQVFKTDKASFAKLPGWKQIATKKSAGLY